MERSWAAGLVLAGVFFAASLPARADTIEIVNYTYADMAAGGLVANVSMTWDQTTGQALSASGTINSSLFVQSDGVTPLGPQSMFLVTANSTSPVIRATYADGSFLWQDSDGTNLQADTKFGTTFPYVDSYGLSFAVGTPNSHGSYASFNFYDIGNTMYDGEFLGNGGPPGQGQVYNTSSQGVLTINSITPVPVPAAAWLLISGLLGAGPFFARRRPLPAPA